VDTGGGLLAVDETHAGGVVDQFRRRTSARWMPRDSRNRVRWAAVLDERRVRDWAGVAGPFICRPSFPHMTAGRFMALRRDFWK